MCLCSFFQRGVGKLYNAGRTDSEFITLPCPSIKCRTFCKALYYEYAKRQTTGSSIRGMCFWFFSPSLNTSPGHPAKRCRWESQRFPVRLKPVQTKRNERFLRFLEQLVGTACLGPGMPETSVCLPPVRPLRTPPPTPLRQVLVHNASVRRILVRPPPGPIRPSVRWISTVASDPKSVASCRSRSRRSSPYR